MQKRLTYKKQGVIICPYKAKNALQKRNKDKIAVYTGIEKDYFSKIDRSKYDYVIASVHFLVAGGRYYAIDHARDVQQDYIDNVCGGDVLKFVRDYFFISGRDAAAMD